MDQPLRAVIADDEPLSLRRLEIALSQMPDVEICAAARDGPSALEAIRRTRPDVALLDIKMPGMSGLELASALEEGVAPVLIFVTAFGRFATSAFELAAVDYLLKPIAYERLRHSIERARATLAAKDAAMRVEELKRLVESLRADEPERLETQELWAPSASGLVRISARSIDMAEAQRDYVRLHVGPRSYLLRHSMTALAEQLGEEHFLRVHRSAIVRRDNIVSIATRRSGGLQVVLASGQTVPVGSRYERAVKAMIARRSRTRPEG